MEVGKIIDDKRNSKHGYDPFAVKSIFYGHSADLSHLVTLQSGCDGQLITVLTDL
jgi:hypothetical protein